MKKTQKIGWQKYEDVLEAQISSPLMELMFKSLEKSLKEEEVSEETEIDYSQEEEVEKEEPVMVNVTNDLSNEITLSANFDCWMGHTNFNLTEDIKDNLNKIDGVEVLKICSRYRFFIGIGRMFDFSDVRKKIEKEIMTNQGV